MGAFDEIIEKFSGALGRMGSADAMQGEAVSAFFRSIVPPKRTSPPPSPPGTFQENYERAVREMRERGVTSEQAATFRPINKYINQYIKPWGYRTGVSATESVPADQLNDVDLQVMRAGRDRETLEQKYPGREDAWRLYLGMPQKHGMFSVSPYQPASSKDRSAVYYRMNNFWQDRLGLLAGVTRSEADAIPIIFETSEGRLGRGQDETRGVMGNYTLGRGQDERGPYISYYDRWDLDRSDVEGKEGRYGKPFEIYDRLYYDLDKGKIYWDGPPAMPAPPVR